MGKIHILDTEISNKIAAGEVVERPLSIVKELVENSIDAGATNITVEIRNGGISFIRVTDNGCGMSEEDAQICFLRHATSKIQKDSDLNAIYTLGFRGEALSSIGAVTCVKLYTKRTEDETGTCVTCEGGEIVSSNDAGAPNGTVIEVSDLFYNTPARLKFLKKNTTEAGYIQDIITRLALAHPEISFKLIRDSKEILFTSGDNKLINVVYAVYGKDYARNMLEVDYEFNGIKVTGVIGKGTLVRANRNNETFFVNRRYIKSALMIRALEEAYKNQIMISKFPTAILNVELDVSSVDINVHPTKLECKFSNEHDIYQAVYHAVKTALYALPNVPEIERGEERKNISENIFKAEMGEQGSMDELLSDTRSQNVIRPSNEFKFSTLKRSEVKMWDSPAGKEEKPVQTSYENNEVIPSQYIKDEASIADEKNIKNNNNKTDKKPETAECNKESNENRELMAEKSVELENECDVLAMLDFAIERSKNAQGIKIQVHEGNYSVTEEQKENDDWESFLQNANERYIRKKKEENNVFSQGYYRVIGQVFGTYILVEKDERLLMIDQHAAHERLNYESLKAELEKREISSQLLIMPVEIRLSGEEAALYEENSELFYELGFDIELKDGNNIEIKSSPGEIGYGETEDLFIELLTQVGDMKNDIISHDNQRLIYTIACKASVKANTEMSIPEMENLVKRVFELENINTCPHGRPIVISMSKKEIEKDFKRIV